MPGPIPLWRGLAITALAGLTIAGPAARVRAGTADGFGQARATADPAIAQRLARIQQALFSGSADVQAAIRELTSILALDPQSHDAHVLLGIAYRSLATQEFIAESVAEF